MYEYLEGTVASRSVTRLVLDVGGVGFDLLVPLVASLPDAGQRSRIWVHLAVREDSQTLYGFATADDRDLFRLLLKVRGVGPTLALSVLSGLSREALVRAVLDEDLGMLTRLKGVGKKTAEQMLLDLRDKAAELAGGSSAKARAGATPAAVHDAGEVNVADAVAALISIGYSEKDARKQVERAAAAVDSEDLEALVRAAIQG